MVRYNVYNPIMSGGIQFFIEVSAIQYMGHGFYDLILSMENTE